MGKYGTLIPSSDSIRLTASNAGRKLALDLSKSWSKAKVSAPGPIDVIDLFSGCGGMSAGFFAANAIAPAYRLIMAVDIDDDSNRSYAANLGRSPIKADIEALARNPRQVRQLVKERRSRADGPLVMIGCAPCQGFSSHRNAAGLTDVRNSLFAAFAQIAALIKPDVVIIENVPELLTDQHWPVVSRARSILSNAGYISKISIHNLAEFGVPQHRFRALMVAMRRNFRMPHGFLDRDGFRTVRDAIGRLSRIDAGLVAPTDPMHFTANHHASTIATIRAVPHDGGSRPWHAGPDCLRRAEARQGRAAYEDVYGRLWWDRPAITITAYARNPASGRYVHPEQDRGLSVREAALLQGFPHGYTFAGSFDSRFRQIGNAVPPTFAAFLAVHVVRELLEEEPANEEDRDILGPIGPSFSRMIPALKAGFRRLEGGIPHRI